MKKSLYLILISAIITCLIPIGCTEDESKNQPPTCIITSPDNGDEIQQGQTVTISVNATDTDGNVTEVRFFVDGTEVGSLSSFPYNYNWNTTDEETGSYTLKAIAKDNTGESTIDEIAVKLVEALPVAGFSANYTTITEGTIVNFSNLSTSTSTTIWLWDFGDGTTSTYPAVAHEFVTEGVYTISLTATNDRGSDTDTKINYITVSKAGIAPVAAFIANKIKITEGESISFTDQSTNTPTSWSWNFGDGNTSTLHNPTHTYSTEGIYTVTLTANNSLGSDAETKVDYIAVYPVLTDIDGNTYNIVTIGTQDWMAENLKVTKYPDGTAIPLVTDKIAWGELGDNNTDAAYCYYDNTAANLDVYGALYTYAAAKSVCPTGWHLPTDAEWSTLETFISNDGHSGTEGTALKTTSGWYLDSNGTDYYGFSGLPSGYRRYDDGTFYNAGKSGYLWSSTEVDSSRTYRRYLRYFDTSFSRTSYFKSNGFSVRCLMD